MFFLALSVNAQLFGDKQKTALVKKGVGYVYNMQPDSAVIYIDSIDFALPDHPVVRSDIADYYAEVELFDQEIGEVEALVLAVRVADHVQVPRTDGQARRRTG